MLSIPLLVRGDVSAGSGQITIDLQMRKMVWLVLRGCQPSMIRRVPRMRRKYIGVRGGVDEDGRLGLRVGHHGTVHPIDLQVKWLNVVRIRSGLAKQGAASLVQEDREDLILLLVDL